MVRLYHYTSRSGYLGIQSSQRINKARRHTRYGEGVYFNSRRVNNYSITKEHIADENYQGGGDANRARGFVDYVVAVDFPDGDVSCVNANRHLWLYKTDDYLDLTKYTYSLQAV